MTTNCAHTTYESSARLIEDAFTKGDIFMVVKISFMLDITNELGINIGILVSGIADGIDSHIFTY